MVIISEQNSATRVQTLNKAINISHCTNTPAKGMNLACLIPAMGKQLSRLSSWTFVGNSSRRKLLKPVVDLDGNGLHIVILVQDTLHE